MNHLTHQQLQELKAALQKEKLELSAHFEAQADNGGSLLETTGELSSYDNHPGDIGTETFERSRDLAVDELLEEKLQQVKSALARMESGEYGKCEKCEGAIPFERLQVLPYAVFCMEHAEEAEQLETLEGRPKEEEVMTPPPSGAGKNRQEHAGRFDDADAWESVESYGNSDHPGQECQKEE